MLRRTALFFLLFCLGRGVVAQEQHLPVFDVKENYGGSTADALNALNAAGGGILYYAANTNFSVSGTSVIGNGASVICGAGAQITTSDPNADIFDVTGYNSRVDGCGFATSVLRTNGFYVNLEGAASRLSNFRMASAFNGVAINGATVTVENGFATATINNVITCLQAGDAHVRGVTSDSAFWFTASANSGVLTVTAAANFNRLAVGHELYAADGSNSIPYGTVITSFGTGTGGIGTYNLSSPLTFSSQNMVSGGMTRGVELLGTAGAAGCAMSVEGSAFLRGRFSVLADPPSGGTVWLSVVNSYLDNPSLAGVFSQPRAGGSVGMIKVSNSEICTNGSNAHGVYIDASLGGTNDLSFSDIVIGAYTHSVGNAITLVGGTPASLVIHGNSVGAIGLDLFDGGVSLNQSGWSNAIVIGNNLKARVNPFWNSNADDPSCISAFNKMNGGTPSVGCNATGNR